MRKPVVADSEKNLKSTMVNKARLCFAVWRGHFVPELLLCSTLSFDSELLISQGLRSRKCPKRTDGRLAILFSMSA